jgi:predicted TIM-barrel fold metal-dependent hydrolase
VTDRYLLISADCHAGGSMEQYREYLDPEYRDEYDAWRGRYSNPFRDLQSDGRTRNWDSDRRVDELAADGVVAEVLFPNTVPPFFPTGAVIARPPRAKNYARRHAGIRAHNRWLADFCAEAPGRRAGIGQIFLNDVDDAVADVRWIKEHQLRGGALLPGRPDDSEFPPLYDAVYDPLWSVCEELEVPVTHHSGQGSPDYGRSDAASVMWLVETQWFSHRPFWQLIMGGVFDRHPDLSFVVTEQGCSWIPDTLRMLDAYHAQMASGRVGELKYTEDQRLSLTPSEYFARNCYVGVSFPSPAESRAMRTVGLDRVMWGSDYPHNESTYPHTTAGLRRAFADWDPVEVRQVTSENAARIYGFDLDALSPLAVDVGPSVEEITRPLDTVPADSASPAFTRR